jgi:hypothetical protein
MDISQVEWRKSIRSANNGSCVEVGVWRKSSRSASNGGQRFEVSAETTLRLARDSKNPDGSVLAFSPAEWRMFTETIKSGRLNRV